MNRHKTTTIFSLPLSPATSPPTSGGGCRSSCNKRHTRAINSFDSNQTNQSLLQTITILPTNNGPCRRLEISPQLAREALKLMLLWRRLATPTQSPNSCTNIPMIPFTSFHRRRHYVVRCRSCRLLFLFNAMHCLNVRRRSPLSKESRRVDPI